MRWPLFGLLVIGVLVSLGTTAAAQPCQPHCLDTLSAGLGASWMGLVGTALLVGAVGFAVVTREDAG